MLELLRQPWAIHPDHAPMMARKIIAAAIEGREGQEMQTAPEPMRAGRIARMMLYGAMSQHWLPGTVSTAAFGRAFDRLIADETIGAILLDVHSPGGQVFGTAELADKIFSARGRKPIIGQINSQAASAALWTVTAADKVFITPGGEGGSVGVIALHADWSEALAKEGIKVTVMSIPDAKKEGNPFEPLTDAAKADIEAGNAIYYDQFVKAVAKQRGVSVTQVKTQFGAGRMLLAKDALEAGMVDGIQTVEETLAKMQAKIDGKIARAKANANALALASLL